MGSKLIKSTLLLSLCIAIVSTQYVQFRSHNKVQWSQKALSGCIEGTSHNDCWPLRSTERRGGASNLTTFMRRQSGEAAPFRNFLPEIPTWNTMQVREKIRRTSLLLPEQCPLPVSWVEVWPCSSFCPSEVFLAVNFWIFYHNI